MPTISTVAKGGTFSVIGREHEWSPKITAVLDIAVEDDRIFPHMCIKCWNRLTTWGDAIDDLNYFRKLAQSSLQAQKSGPRYPDMAFSTIDIVPLQYIYLK